MSTVDNSFPSEPHSSSSYSHDGSVTNNATETNVLKTENNRKRSPKKAILHAIAFPLETVGKFVFLNRNRGRAYEPVLSKAPADEAAPLDRNP